MQIKIGPYTYDVVFGLDEIAKVGVEEQRDLLGHTSRRKLRILIRNDYPEVIQRETLLHEILHAIWSYTGMINRELTEEEIIMSIAPNLLAIMLDNPEVTDWILNGSDTATSPPSLKPA